MSLDDELRRAGARLNSELEHVPVPQTPHQMGRLKVLAVAAVVTIIVGGAALWLARSDAPTPVAPTVTTTAPPESTTTSTTTAAEADEEPVTRVPTFVVADGPYDGADETWTLTAYLDENGSICMELDGTLCGRVPSTETPLSGPFMTIDHLAEPPLSCVFGAIDSSVSEVVVTFPDGDLVYTAIYDGQAIPAQFFAYCWAGDFLPTSVTALDRDSEVLAESPTPSTGSRTTTTLPAVEPINGWTSTGADPGVFGAVTITDAVVIGGSIVAVGCPGEGEPGFPVWMSDDGVTWERAEGLTRIGSMRLGCLTDVIESSFGLFTYGSTLLRSGDGRRWEPIEFLSDEGYSIGYVDAVFSTPDRLTVLLRRGAEAESTVATLFTTTDGTTWQQASASDAELFNNAAISDVITSDSGLIAVGASPWGEFVPTAAVWTSADSIDWQLVTPRGEGFEDAYMYTIAETDTGYVALGGSPSGTNLMAVWTSPNGIDWTRQPPPLGDTVAEFGFMEAYAVTRVDSRFYAAGLDFDAGRAFESLPAMWVSSDGTTWQRQNFDDIGGLVPFTIIDINGRSLGFWPPPSWPTLEAVRVMAR